MTAGSDIFRFHHFFPWWGSQNSWWNHFSPLWERYGTQIQPAFTHIDSDIIAAVMFFTVNCLIKSTFLHFPSDWCTGNLRPWNNAETLLDCYKTCEANGIKSCYGKLTFPIWPLQGQHTASCDSKWILRLSSSKTSMKWTFIIYLKLFVPHGNFPSHNKYCMCILTAGHMHRWVEYDTNPSETLYSTIAPGALPPYLPPL